MTTDYQQLLGEIAEEVRPLIGQGHVANYIPALARVDPDNFAMALRTIDGQEFSVGSADTRFSFSVNAPAYRFFDRAWRLTLMRLADRQGACRPVAQARVRLLSAVVNIEHPQPFC